VAGNFSKDSFSGAVGGFSVGPYPSTGGGGGGGFVWGGRKRNKTFALFDKLEQTLRDILQPPSVTVGTEKAAVLDVDKSINKVVRRMESAAKDNDELRQRIADVRKEIAAYWADEDDDEMMMLH
jgi:hypothetical protein